jgi:hypothetical protein
MAKTTFDPKSFLATASRGRSVAAYRKDDVIFSQESPADAVFYIRTGSIKLVVTSTQGKDAIAAILGAGEFFGEGCLIGQPLRLATARAMVERSDADRKGRDDSCPARRAELRRTVHRSSADPRQPRRGGPDRPAIQLERTKPMAREPVRYTQARRYRIEIGGG